MVELNGKTWYNSIYQLKVAKNGEFYKERE